MRHVRAIRTALLAGAVLLAASAGTVRAATPYRSAVAPERRVAEPGGEPRGRGQQPPQPVPAQAPQGPDQQRSVETITVTATRLPVRLSDLPTAARVYSADELQAAPAIVLDDALRATPSASLFRRTSSRDSHPTAQGLNLRGIGPSGVSRALVLVDGIPMNDPFGGWVYWDRVPLLALEQVEVAPGGGSSPYGSQALGGVIQLVTRRDMASHLQLQALGGSQSTARFGAAVGAAGNGAAVFLSAQAFNTAGYIQTSAAERGSVDTNITLNDRAVRLRIDTPGGVTVNAETLRERRNNGTPLQRNNTSFSGVSAAWSGTTAPGTAGWNVHGFGRDQVFESSFSSVAADRNSERLVLLQRVPSTDLGAGGYGWRDWGDRATVSFGGDWRRVNGHSKELVIFNGATRAPGGIQHLGGGFAALDMGLSREWAISLSVRGDGWHQNPVETPGETRGGGTLSPRAGVTWQSDGNLTMRGAVYRAFRAPTLNELYRQFRVGNISTAANSDLVAETLLGAEIGGDWSADVGSGGARLTLGSTFYWNRLDDAVINATLAVRPNLILRRRENFGAATARGIEVDGRLQLRRGWHVDVAYSWLDSIFRDATGTATSSALEGNRLPQVPTYRARAALGYQAGSGWAGLLSVRALGEQFEDDRNELRLAPAVVVDGSIEVPVVEGVRFTLRAENLFDEKVEARRTPNLGHAAPRLVYAGITLTWPGN